MDAGVWSAIGAVASAVAAVAAVGVAVTALRLQKTMHEESGRMVAVSGSTITKEDPDGSALEAAISVQIRNAGRMETTVESVVVSFPAHGSREAVFYPYVLAGVVVPAGDGMVRWTPFYPCESHLVECRVEVRLGDGQVLTQPLSCYEPSAGSGRWPQIEQ